MWASLRKSGKKHIDPTQATMLQDYKAHDENEISFSKGDSIIIIDVDSSGWGYGRVKNTHKEGWFPMSMAQTVLSSPTGKVEGNSIVSKRKTTEDKLNRFFNPLGPLSRPTSQTLQDKNILKGQPSDSTKIVEAKISLEKTSKVQVLSDFLKRRRPRSSSVSPSRVEIPSGPKDWRLSPKVDGIPIEIKCCIDILKRDENIKIEGLFRKCGSFTDLEKIKSSLDASPESMQFHLYDVHTVASFLKDYLRHLPDPIIPAAHYDEIIVVMRTDKEKLERIVKEVGKLPSENKVFLEFVLIFLNEVASFQEYNLMNVANLAIVFGPNLLRSGRSNSLDAISDMSKVVEFAHLLIDWGGLGPRSTSTTTNS